MFLQRSKRHLRKTSVFVNSAQKNHLSRLTAPHAVSSEHMALVCSYRTGHWKTSPIPSVDLLVQEGFFPPGKFICQGHLSSRHRAFLQIKNAASAHLWSPARWPAAGLLRGTGLLPDKTLPTGTARLSLFRSVRTPAPRVLQSVFCHALQSLFSCLTGFMSNGPEVK